MTAHSEITGTRVLVAPAHIRGPMGKYADPSLKRARAAWIASLPASVTYEEVAAALGIARTPAGRLLRRYRPLSSVISRRGFMSRGILIGRIDDTIVERMTWEQQDALEVHCARTGQTIADALVELWATVHAGERE